MASIIITTASPTKPTILFSSLRATATAAAAAVFLFSPKTLAFNQKLTASSPRRVEAAAAAKSKSTGEQKFTHEGSVTESLPNGMFRVKLDNEDLIIGYISGKIRKNFVRILPGDRVRVEVSRYDSSRGRIVYRMRNRSDSASD